MPTPAEELWQARLSDELRYWASWMETRGLQWKQEFRSRLDPETQFPDFLRELIDPGLTHVHVLDVGAGPVTCLGRRWEGRDVHITAIDPLADEYTELRKRYGLVAPILTRQCAGEDVARTFALDSFDLAHARNSLDHAYDPAVIVRGMLDVVKPDGVVYLIHSIREADKQNHEGLHQHNLYPDAAGDFYCETAGLATNLTWMFRDQADTTTRVDGDWFAVTMRKKPA